MSAHPALESAYYSELEKIAKEKDKDSDRVRAVLPGAAAVAGGLAGTLNPKMFNPKALFPGMKTKSTQGRVISGLLGAGTAATTAALPYTVADAVKAMKKEGNQKMPPNLMEDPDGNPAVKILGASIEKIDDKTARSVPILQPPPGYIYDPELGAFKPNSDDPGWMTAPEALQARENAQAFQAGADQATRTMARQEADNAAAATMAQNQPPPAEPAPQPGDAQQAAPVPPSPGGVVGDFPMAQDGQTPQAAGPKAPRPNSSNSIAR